MAIFPFVYGLILYLILSGVYSQQLELQSKGKMLLSASIHLIQLWFWGICLQHFSLRLLWLGIFPCSTLTKDNLFHKVLCLEAPVLWYSSTLPCKHTFLGSHSPTLDKALSCWFVILNRQSCAHKHTKMFLLVSYTHSMVLEPTTSPSIPSLWEKGMTIEL